MTLLEETEHFARVKNADIAFSKGVVFRLKAIGVTDENILCAAMLYKTGAGFEEIFARFGREIATLVTSISKDTSLPKQRQEEQYVKQIRSAPWESTLIKICEISANLKFIREAEMSKTKKSRELRKNIHYLNSLKDNITKNREKTPGVERLLEGINETLTGHFRQRPISY